MWYPITLRSQINLRYSVRSKLTSEAPLERLSYLRVKLPLLNLFNFSSMMPNYQFIRERRGGVTVAIVINASPYSEERVLNHSARFIAICYTMHLVTAI